MFVEDNKLFIVLANVIHQQGVTAEMKQHIREHIRERILDVYANYSRGERILDVYANYSKKPIYKDDISYETLDITAEIYSRIVFILEWSVVRDILFYHRMFETFPLEIVLKTLARILSGTKQQKDNNADYKTAKAVFIKITEMLNLTNRDVEVSTTASEEMSSYHDDGLDNYEVNQDNINSEYNQLLPLQ